MTVAARGDVTDRFSPSIVAITATGALYPLHRQNGHEIIYLEHGDGIMYVGGLARHLHAGDLVFVDRLSTHGFCFSPDSSALLAGISCDLMPQFTEFVDEMNVSAFIIKHALDDPEIYQAIGHLISHPTAFKTGIKLMSGFGLLLDSLSTRMTRAKHLPQRHCESMEDRFARAAYIEVDEMNPSLDSIAQTVGISRTYASRSLKPVLGLSLASYTAVTRVNAARRLLVQTDRPVGEIALMCRYSSIRTFNRQFADVAGMTALAYRKAYSNSQTIGYDLPRYRSELEMFFSRLADASPEIPID